MENSIFKKKIKLLKLLILELIIILLTTISILLK